MKKFFALMLAIALLATMTACGGNNADNGDNAAPETVKFGSAYVLSSLAATDATEDKNGQGSVDLTAAVITLDKDGKIVACDLDTLQIKAAYTTAGKAVANAEFKTKREQGDAYNMVTYGQAKQEWYKQADAFEALIVGKTVADVRGLVVNETNKGTDEVINAGCTIMINEFVNAIEKAAHGAEDSDLTKDATVKVTMAVEQTPTDATEDKAGSNKVATTIFAAALKDGKVALASSDCVEIDFTFDVAGKSTFDASKEIKSKREKGDNYGMVAYAGAAKEWYAQADAFDAACVGKTAAEIAGLKADDGKGVDSLKSAGCTIYVTGFVAAASKI